MTYKSDTDEVKSWRSAALTMTIIAGIVFIVQQFFTHLFDQVFVICVFYLPAFILIIAYMWVKRASERFQS
jgi:hypothetical protein